MANNIKADVKTARQLMIVLSLYGDKTQWVRDIIENYDADRESLENEGDIQELIRLLVQGEMDELMGRQHVMTVWQRFTELHKFLDIAGKLTDYDDIKEIKAFKDFKEKYPALAMTMVVWAWG